MQESVKQSGYELMRRWLPRYVQGDEQITKLPEIFISPLSLSSMHSS